MSRSEYTNDGEDQLALNRWRGAVKSAIRGRRGQAFLREMLEALDALPEKRLAKDVLVQEGEVCALGAVAVKRSLDVSGIDLEDYEAHYQISQTFGIANALAREIMWCNDENYFFDGMFVREPTPEQRYEIVRSWVVRAIRGDV